MGRETGRMQQNCSNEKRAHTEKTWERVEKGKGIMLCSVNKLKCHSNKNFLVNVSF
jgi:hypothetical protein